MTKTPKRPTDPMQLAKLVGDIVTGQVAANDTPTAEDVRRVMSALGKKGGPKGGAARAQALSKKRRKEIAVKAAKARWKKKKA